MTQTFKTFRELRSSMDKDFRKLEEAKKANLQRKRAVKTVQKEIEDLKEQIEKKADQIKKLQVNYKNIQEDKITIPNFPKCVALANIRREVGRISQNQRHLKSELVQKEANLELLK